MTTGAVASNTTTVRLFWAALFLSSSCACVDAALTLDGILSYFSSAGGGGGGDVDGPNNNQRELIERYGLHGYRKLVNDALGMIVDDDAEEEEEEDDVSNNDDDSNAHAHQCPGSGSGYGVDVSFPIHHLPRERGPPSDMPQPLADRSTFYEDYVKGCRDYYPGEGGKKQRHQCDVTEEERCQMNLRQPPSMQNYTELGFQKVKAPTHIYSMLRQFWDTNHDEDQDDRNDGSKSIESWPAGNTYTNHWSSPTYMVNIDDVRLVQRANIGIGSNPSQFKRRIWNSVKSVLAEWLSSSPRNHNPQQKLELTPSSLYGIRVYGPDAVLAPHVDRLPLVTSAIINIAQDVDEPWPLEVYGHDGCVYNITMEPGEMILYESHSVIHGRPFPLKGRYYANVFIHFEPTGHTLRHTSDGGRGGGETAATAREQYKRVKAASAKETASASPNAAGGGGARVKSKRTTTATHGHDDLPYYIARGSEAEKKWRQRNPGNNPKTKVSVEFGSLNAHQAAARGDLEMLKELAAEDPKVLYQRDANGWQPIHEAARSGRPEVLEYLIKQGADVNARTNRGKGGTPLWWAIQKHGEGHKCVKLLRENMGVSIGPTT